MSKLECPVRDCDIVDDSREMIYHFTNHRLYEQKYVILDFLNGFDPDTSKLDTVRDNVFGYNIEDEVELYREGIEDHILFDTNMIEAFFGSMDSAVREALISSDDVGYVIPEENRIDWRREKILDLGSYDRQKYGPNYPQQRRKALERDDLTCRVCGDTHFDSDSRIQIHHITPASWFHEQSSDGGVDYEEINDLSNLITLCASCHGNLEGRWTHCDHNEFAEKAKLVI